MRPVVHRILVVRHGVWSEEGGIGQSHQLHEKLEILAFPRQSTHAPVGALSRVEPVGYQLECVNATGARATSISRWGP